MKVRKRISKTLAVFATVAFGFLGFTGMLIFSSSIAWGLAAFGFAAIIEGEIFNKYISTAIKNLFKGPEQEIKRACAKRELRNLFLQQQSNERQVLDENIEKYMQTYIQLQAYLAELKLAEHHNHHLKTSQEQQRRLKAQRKKIKQIEMQIEHMEDFYIRCMLEPAQGVVTPLETALRAYTQPKQIAMANEVRRKWYLLNLGGICSIGAAVGSGLVALASSQIGLAALGIAAGSLLSVSLIGLIAVPAAIGYGLILYACITDMLQHDIFHKWINKVQQYFKRDLTNEENKFRFFIRCAIATIGVTAIVALAVFATISTAGTWWVVAKKGAMILGGLSERVANGLRTIVVAAMGLPSLVYNIYNSVKTYTTTHFIDPIKDIYNEIQTHRANKTLLTYFNPRNETALQYFNPFRLILALASFVVRGGIFLLHVGGVGLTGDQLPDVSPAIANAMGGDLMAHKITTVLGAGAEAVTDWHIIKPHDHPTVPHNHIEPEEEESDHHHSDFSGWAIKYVLAPIFLPLKGLAILWDFVFGERNWTKSKEKFFPIHQEEAAFKDAKAPQIDGNFSQALTNQRIIDGCKEQVAKLQSETTPFLKKDLIQQKITAFQELATTAQQDTAQVPAVIETHKNIIATHRNHFFASKRETKTASQAFVKTVLSDDQYREIFKVRKGA